MELPILVKTCDLFVYLNVHFRSYQFEEEVTGAFVANIFINPLLCSVHLVKQQMQLLKQSVRLGIRNQLHRGASPKYIQSESKLLALCRFFHQIVKSSQARVDFNGLGYISTTRSLFLIPTNVDGGITTDVA